MVSLLEYCGVDIVKVEHAHVFPGPQPSQSAHHYQTSDGLSPASARAHDGSVARQLEGSLHLHTHM